ncbi:PfkB family carbohydrate kinase [Streptomyces sp. NBRC 109706]|uniref:PfkB family carbohydrate kinase n=1 Tax=Streptomyces sp. NBRC 109706 TaxID=1550035 RepID=UPI0007802D0B|nr:PfkB family carbohydrate kinase [Streptomyces sp. NBRC 109706]
MTVRAVPDVAPDVLVVGSVNGDLTVDVDRPPVRGETVLGGAVERGPGGKGANQAVALARLGRSVGLLGAVGEDAEGASALAALRAEGVDTAWLARVAGPTGLAVVLRDSGADSTIVVAPGANAAVTPAAVAAAAPALAAARAVLCQLEIPLAAVEAAAAATRGLFALNPAPALPLPPTLLDRVDLLVPNRFELATLTGTTDLTEGVRRLRVPRLVVTLGADGCLVHEAGHSHRLPARPVVARDTTAAGDSFCAALLDALLAGRPLLAAAERATHAAALTTTHPGALPSLPHHTSLP